MNYALFIIFLFIAAILAAKAEIQIEGKDGWAQNLPTWRFQIKSRYIFLNREITGYHIFFFSLVLFLPHTIFLFILWSLKIELAIIGFYLMFTVLEDFMWFILNPNYRFKKFNAQSIKWHKKWLFGVPFDYWISMPIGIFLLTLSYTL